MNKKLRRAIIAGNWKMNKTTAEAATLIQELLPLVKTADCGVIVCVPYTNLHTAIAACKGTNVAVAAQNCHWAENGAYTGEISALMLKDLGVQYVVLGHSERRQYFAETDTTVNQRTLAALAAGLSPIVCVGETLDQRQQGITEELCRQQVKIALQGVSVSQLKSCIIAYEPVWAIGTGKTATVEEANAVCAAIRKVLAELYSPAAADATTIQYGGSMNAANAADLLAQPDVDGGLIGGASLKAADFTAIITAASK